MPPRQNRSLDPRCQQLYLKCQPFRIKQVGEGSQTATPMRVLSMQNSKGIFIYIHLPPSRSLVCHSTCVNQKQSFLHKNMEVICSIAILQKIKLLGYFFLANFQTNSILLVPCWFASCAINDRFLFVTFTFSQWLEFVTIATNQLFTSGAAY